MSTQAARAEVQRLADELDDLPPDTPIAVRREKCLAYQLAMQDYRFAERMARYQRQQVENEHNGSPT